MRRAGIVQTFVDLVGFARIRATSRGSAKSVQVHIAAHQDDPGGDACEFWGHAPLLYGPGADAEALYLELGDERVVIATKDRRHQIEVAEGEVVVRALGSATSSYVKLKPDGSAEVHATQINLGGSASQFVALANLVSAQLSALKAAITAAAVGNADGGTLFKSNLLGALESWPASVAATKTQAE